MIVDRINIQGRVSVDALAASMSISRETIRRDLATLADKGLIFKFHGGARPLGATRRRPHHDVAAQQQHVAHVLWQGISRGARGVGEGQPEAAAMHVYRRIPTLNLE